MNRVRRYDPNMSQMGPSSGKFVEGKAGARNVRSRTHARTA